MSRRRVVITGVGAISSLGLSMPTTWGKLLEGQLSNLSVSLCSSSSKTGRPWTSELGLAVLME